MSSFKKLIGFVFVVTLSGCASEYEQNKRKEYKRLKPPCSYEDFIFQSPLYGCEGAVVSPENYAPYEKVDPNDPRPLTVPPVV